MQGVLNKEPRKSRRRVSTREVATRYRDSPRNERGGARVRARVYTRGNIVRHALNVKGSRRAAGHRHNACLLGHAYLKLQRYIPAPTGPSKEPPSGTRNLLQRLLLHSVNPFTEKSFVNGRRRRVFFPFTSLIQSFDRLKQNENLLVRGELYLYSSSLGWKFKIVDERFAIIERDNHVCKWKCFLVTQSEVWSQT